MLKSGMPMRSGPTTLTFLLRAGAGAGLRWRDVAASVQVDRIEARVDSAPARPAKLGGRSCRRRRSGSVAAVPVDLERLVQRVHARSRAERLIVGAASRGSRRGRRVERASQFERQFGKAGSTLEAGLAASGAARSRGDGRGHSLAKFSVSGRSSPGACSARSGVAGPARQRGAIDSSGTSASGSAMSAASIAETSPVSPACERRS
jgi:hypothetical protein